MPHDLWGRVEALKLKRPGFKFWICDFLWSWTRSVTSWCHFSPPRRRMIMCQLPGRAMLKTDWAVLIERTISSRCYYYFYFHSLYFFTTYPNYYCLFQLKKTFIFHPGSLISSHWNVGSCWGMKYYERSKFHFIGNLISLWAVIKALIRITTVCPIKIIQRQMWVFRKKCSSNYKAKNWKRKWHVKDLRT